MAGKISTWILALALTSLLSPFPTIQPALCSAIDLSLDRQLLESGLSPPFSIPEAHKTYDDLANIAVREAQPVRTARPKGPQSWCTQVNAYQSPSTGQWQDDIHLYLHRWIAVCDQVITWVTKNCERTNHPVWAPREPHSRARGCSIRLLMPREDEEFSFQDAKRRSSCVLEAVKCLAESENLEPPEFCV